MSERSSDLASNLASDPAANLASDPTSNLASNPASNPVSNAASSPASDAATATATPDEDLFRAFARHCRDGIFIVDRRGVVVEWNEGHEAITGITREHAVGRPIWELHYELTP